jgi:serine/threonine protein kinase
MYKINFDKIIGTGHNGDVYETNKNFLTKHPVSEKEIKISKKLSNIIGPNIVKVIKTKTFNETKKISLNNKEIKLKGNFMIMEKLNGSDLNDYIQEDIFIEDDDYWVKDLVMKIKKMHELGYHHNDLTTSNVFIIYNKVNKVIGVRIIDFGETKPITKKGKIDDYKTLLQSIETFGFYLQDKLQPLIYALDEELEKLI